MKNLKLTKEVIRMISRLPVDGRPAERDTEDPMGVTCGAKK